MNDLQEKQPGKFRKIPGFGRATGQEPGYVRFPLDSSVYLKQS